MTCIVGLAHRGGVIIGGDSAGVDTGRYGLTVRRDPKVFRNGMFIFGFTSSFRMGQLLAHGFVPPRPRAGDDLYGFMVTEFVDAVRKCLKDGGFATKQDEGEVGGTFLVGHAERLFRIDSDFQVGESHCGYDAVGCGDHFALGSLFATEGSDISPEDRIEQALRAAENFSAAVRAPFLIEHIGRGA